MGAFDDVCYHRQRLPRLRVVSSDWRGEWHLCPAIRVFVDLLCDIYPSARALVSFGSPAQPSARDTGPTVRRISWWAPMGAGCRKRAGGGDTAHVDPQSPAPHGEVGESFQRRLVPTGVERG